MKFLPHVLFVQYFACTALALASFRQFNFRRRESNDNIKGKMAGWSAPSRIGCAVTCIMKGSLCYSFTYSTETNLCMSGSWPVGPSSAQREIFSCAACSTPEFELYMRKDVTMCTMMSRDLLNYTSFLSACKAKEAKPLTLKSVNKIELFTDLIRPLGQYFWIGIDDIQKEGVFRWADDGSKVTLQLMRLIFAPGQPDNSGNNEDCGCYDINIPPVNDNICQMKFRYLCETAPKAS